MNLIQILKDHKEWLDNADKGMRANLRNVDLRDADLSGADLRSADLRYVDLRNADPSYAIMRNADLRDADLSNADLSYADLRNAGLCNADLSGADLRWSIGNNNELKSLQFGGWHISYTLTDMAIGCEQHTIKDWMKFSDKEINCMDSKALEWWSMWKPVLKSIFKNQGIEY